MPNQEVLQDNRVIARCVRSRVQECYHWVRNHLAQVFIDRRVAIKLFQIKTAELFELRWLMSEPTA